ATSARPDRTARAYARRSLSSAKSETTDASSRWSSEMASGMAPPLPLDDNRLTTRGRAGEQALAKEQVGAAAAVHQPAADIAVGTPSCPQLAESPTIRRAIGHAISAPRGRRT